MSHFGVICPPVTGHVDPLAAVGRTLIRRGHQVTLIHVRDMETKARAAGMQFAALGDLDYPAGALEQSVARLSKLSGMAALKFSVSCAQRITETILRHGPETMKRLSIDALLVDQNEPSGASVAEHLGIPFLSACTSLPLNREPQIPPPFFPWKFSAGSFAKIRNRLGYTVADRIVAPINVALNKYRKIWGLPEIMEPDDTFSKTASIAQMPREFDFPRKHLPDTFHYLGPWFDDRSSAGIPFPFEKLDGRRLVYGSLGTLQPAASAYFRIMAEACSGLDVQLVLSLGKEAEEAALAFPGSPIVVNYAPQLELLRRAAVTITHGGMNTTQQSLYFGVPAVAIPLAHDQPAIAARLSRCDAGIVIPPSRLTVSRLAQAIQTLLPETSEFRTAARSLQAAIAKAGGVERAADIAEQLVPTKPGAVT
jgi:zeaxanthin glucosyltransferase